MIVVREPKTLYSVLYDPSFKGGLRDRGTYESCRGQIDNALNKGEISESARDRPITKLDFFQQKYIEEMRNTHS